MIGSKFTEHGPANSGTALPSSDKQQPIKTALRDLQNDNRILEPKSTGKPPSVKDRGPLPRDAMVSGIKRPATECLQKPKCNQAPTSSGSNGPLVYARRKCEQELPAKSNELMKDKKTDCAQADQQEKEKPQQQAQSESMKKSDSSATSTTSSTVTVLPKSNEFEKDKNTDRAQEDQKDKERPKQQTQSESTKKSSSSAISTISSTVMILPNSNKFEKDKNTDRAQEDQKDKERPQQQAQSESTKKSSSSAISPTSSTVMILPKSNKFEKDKNTDRAQEDQKDKERPQQQAQSESTKKSNSSAISATSPIVTLPPKNDQFEMEKNNDCAQKDQQEHGQPQQQAQSEPTKKSCLSTISATPPVVTSGGSSSFLVRPPNENSSEKTNATNTSEVSHSGKSEGANDQHWKERFLQLQTHLRNCDQSRNLETIKKLQTLTPVGRSKHAVELEKRAIQLLLEEGAELMRMKELNVLGKPVAKNPAPTTSAPPSSNQLQTEN